MDTGNKLLVIKILMRMLYHLGWARPSASNWKNELVMDNTLTSILTPTTSKMHYKSPIMAGSNGGPGPRECQQWLVLLHGSHPMIHQLLMLLLDHPSDFTSQKENLIVRHSET